METATAVPQASAVKPAKMPNPKSGFIEVWDRPGIGVTFNVQAAKAHLADEDRHFFD